MEDLQKYCKNYDFSEVLKEYRDEFYSRREVMGFIADGDEEGLKPC